MAQSFKLLSNIRTLTAGFAQAPTGSGMRRQFSLTLTPSANTGESGAAAVVSSEVRGAGDIVGIDGNMISHVEPKSGSVGVEPNYCPYVEFVDADYPWRYSLDTAAGAQVKPWLCLLALKADEYQSLGSASTLLERISVTDPSASLPDLEQSWAFAHVQYKDDEGVDDIGSMMRSTPANCLSRLLCMRALEDMTGYTLFLVPVYEQGRLAGLGRSETPGAWDSLAWDAAATEAVELPVYAKWVFQTAANEDFESLANRLEPLPEEDMGEIGSSYPVFIGNPGSPVTFTDADLTMQAEGALQSPSFSRKTDKGTLTLKSELADVLNTVLAYEVRSESEDGPEVDDPVISLPVYGSWHSGATSVSVTGKSWFDSVNLDMRFRYGAGAGARIVKRHQEEFMQACWEQAVDVIAHRRQRSLLQLADATVKRLAEKTLNKMTPESLISLAQPMHALTGVSDGSTVSDMLTAAAIPKGYAARYIRRVFARKATSSQAVSVNGKPATVARVTLPTLPGDTSSGSGMAKALKGKGAYAASPMVKHVVSYTPEKAVFSKADKVVLISPVVSVGSISADSLASSLAQRLLSLPLAKAAYSFGQSSEEALEDSTIGPILGNGIAAYLSEENPSLFIPAAADMPDNYVLLLQENRHFLEAVMVGANHAMMSELIWREYPADLGATIFRRFWDKGADVGDAAYDDIKTLKTWRKLGRNPANTGVTERMVMVVRGDIIRRYPEMLVALDHQPGAASAGWDGASSNLIEPVFSGLLDVHTAYYGFDVSESDIRAALDEYFFLLFEPKGRFRFGLDIAEVNNVSSLDRTFSLLSLDNKKRKVGTYVTSARRTSSANTDTPVTTDELSWANVTLQSSGYIDVEQAVMVGSLPWGSSRDADASNLAKALFQKPVCAVVPAKDLIHED